MAKRQSAGSPTLNKAAENIGAALGQVAARLDRWSKERASIAADLRRLMQSASGMLVDLGGHSRPRSGKRGGRRKGSKVSAETREKLRAAWERRRAAASETAPGGAKKDTKPVDQRGSIRSKAARTWSNRQPGRG